MPGSQTARTTALDALRGRALTCTRCPELTRTRTQVVFGSGPPDADLMFVGEAPGRAEDRDGMPLVGESGHLLDLLLGEIGLCRDAVAVVNVLQCRPPDNRNPLRGEIDSCQEYLFGQLELMQPIVVCSLGSFVTTLLRGDRAPITRIHGVEEVRMIGPRAVRLYPVLHPAAALYTSANLELLRADIARIPELLALGPPEQPTVVEPEPSSPSSEPEPSPPEPAAPDAAESPQLGLF